MDLEHLAVYTGSLAALALAFILGRATGQLEAEREALDRA